MLQNVASGFTQVGSWRKQQFHVPLPKDASAHVNDSNMTLTYIDYEIRPASQPEIFFTTTCFTLFYMVLHCFALFTFFAVSLILFLEKKIPQKRPTFLDAKEVIATLARSLRQTGRLVSRPFLVLVPQVPTAEGWRKMWLVWLVSNWTPHFVPYEVLQSRNE